MRKYQYLRIFAMLWFMFGGISGTLIKNNQHGFLWFVFLCYINALINYIQLI